MKIIKLTILVSPNTLKLVNKTLSRCFLDGLICTSQRFQKRNSVSIKFHKNSHIKVVLYTVNFCVESK